MKLDRKLGFWDVFCISTGAMISSGLFVLPGQAFKTTGPAVILAYALAAIMVIPGLLAKAELATAMPKSGGSYFFVERSMGALPGTLAGLANWLSIALKSAFAMVGIGAFVFLIFPDVGLTPTQWEWIIKGVAIICCIIFTILNIVSVKLTSRIQSVMVIGLLVVLGLFIFTGIPNVNQHPNFDNFMEKGIWRVFATAGLIFVSFGGLTKIASIAEEIRNPGRNIPGAMFMSFIVVSLLYIGAIFVMVGVTDAKILAAGPYGSLTPLSHAANNFMAGRAGMLLLSAAAILAFITTGNSGILSASRSPLAMSRDGLLPSVLQKISHRYGTPHVSILITCGFMIATIALLSISNLIKVASTMMLTLFLLMNVAVLIMRSSKIQNYRPVYRSPLFPWLPLAGIIIYGGLIGAMTAALKDPVPLITMGVFVVAGVVWYFIYGHRHSDRESALVHLVRIVAAKEIRHGKLEQELREIALDREEIIYDRFDKLARDCEILDLPPGATADEMFTMAAEILAKRMKTKPEELLKKFKEREAESSTLIAPGLAIPHIIVEGENHFDILPVRCKEGVRFGEQHELVNMAFILVGSQDERNFHLRALMAIVQIVREEGFADRWMNAPGIEHLRDILLLAKRQRDT